MKHCTRCGKQLEKFIEPTGRYDVDFGLPTYFHGEQCPSVRWWRPYHDKRYVLRAGIKGDARRQDIAAVLGDGYELDT